MIRDYRGYSAQVTLDEEQGMLHGEVLGIADVVTFRGRTVDEVIASFRESVDDYLAYCAERGERPEKPYSGRFVVRVTGDLHRRVALAAAKAEMSMNQWISAVLEHALQNEPVGSPGPTVRRASRRGGLGATRRKSAG